MSAPLPIYADSCRSLRRRRPLLWLPALLAAPFVLQSLGFFAWSPLNSRTVEIDIRSGRIRYTRFFLWCRLSTRIAASSISDAIEPIRDSTEPAWQTVNTFSPGIRHSPHYRFHDAISQMKELSLNWDVAPFSFAARRESVIRLLSAWQRDNDAFGASQYVTRVAKLAAERSTAVPAQRIEIQDLPSNES